MIESSKRLHFGMPQQNEEEVRQSGTISQLSEPSLGRQKEDPSRSSGGLQVPISAILRAPDKSSRRSAGGSKRGNPETFNGCSSHICEPSENSCPINPSLPSYPRLCPINDLPYLLINVSKLSLVSLTATPIGRYRALTHWQQRQKSPFRAAAATRRS